MPQSLLDALQSAGGLASLRAACGQPGAPIDTTTADAHTARALDELALRHPPAEARALLRGLLDADSSETAGLLKGQADHCQRNIAILGADERGRALAHDRVLVRLILADEAAKNDFPADRGRLEFLSSLDKVELGKLDARLATRVDAAAAELATALARAGRDAGFLAICARLGVNSRNERDRLATLKTPPLGDA